MDLSSRDQDGRALFAEFYDHIPPYCERPDVAFFVEAARHSAGPVLELGCGTGRILIPTARAGIEVMGLDLSPAMLAVCREKLRAEPEQVRSKAELALGDMREFESAREFGLVTLPFRSFQYLLTVEDQLSCLANIRRHLASGGKLILDIFNPNIRYLAEEDHEPAVESEFDMPDGRRVTRSHRVASRDLFNQISEIELIYDIHYPDGRAERLVHEFPLRYLFRFEAEHLLARSGFRVEHVYADYDRRPYGSQYPGEMIFVAHKQSGGA